MTRLTNLIFALVAGLGIAACSLPRGAAVSSEVISGAGDANSPFALHVISPDFLTQFAKWPGNQSSKSYPWISHQAGPASPIIAAGDIVSLRIWDSGENSLLSTDGQKATELAGLVVSPSGTIYVPYVGDVLLTGLTPEGARKELQVKIETLIPAVQVQLVHVSGRKNSVDLVGGVMKAGSFQLPDRNFTVLSLLSAGGGVDRGVRNPQIRLVRNNTTYGTSLDNLYEDPSRDTTLRGGDKVIVDEEKRYFVGMGASKNEATIYFSKDNITALDAIAMMGGLNDLRADPEGILVLRNYPTSAIRLDGTGPARDQIVFSIDLTSAEGLFGAKKFEIVPGDVVLATESVVTAASSIVGLFGAVVGVAALTK
ncbi:MULTISPECIES: polysaccharide biosynthesis/export family protein [Falsihalocynthiibacter]|uniref:polysaccharide biosynthesis/export family protein n=1 Tax=Falsihalocynthiibacter TaxID=2854182 RepID=UPI0030019AC8